VCVWSCVCVCVIVCVCVCVWAYMYIHKYVFMTETWGWQAKHAQQFSEVLQSALVWLACSSSVRGCMLGVIRCSMLQCITVCCSVLQSFRGCPRLTSLLYLSIGRHVAVCHSLSQYFALCYSLFVAALVWLACVRALHGCSVMRRLAVCRGVLQYFAVFISKPLQIYTLLFGGFSSIHIS